MGGHATVVTVEIIHSKRGTTNRVLIYLKCVQRFIKMFEQTSRNKVSCMEFHVMSGSTNLPQTNDQTIYKVNKMLKPLYVLKRQLSHLIQITQNVFLKEKIKTCVF